MFVSMQQALAKGSGQWRSFTCPEHEDANPSARVNITTGHWRCMVCGATGKAKDYVPEISLILDNALSKLEPPLEPKPESWLDQFDAGPVPHYWLSRFERPVCRQYRLGWDGTRRQPCYPLRDVDGAPLGVVRRNLDDPEGPKYKYPRGVRTSELLFGLHELPEDQRIITLVEGAMDVCAVREVDFWALGTYGSMLYPEQIDLIASLEPTMVWVAYDNDRAGYIGAKEAVYQLSHGAGIMAERLEFSGRFKDVGEMDYRTRLFTMRKTLAL